jgi:hypothetical protein
MISSPKFELSIILVLIFNMIVCAVEFYNQKNSHKNIAKVINTIFITLYGLESLFKLIGLRGNFFRDTWNIFDLIINILSILCKFYTIYSK